MTFDAMAATCTHMGIPGIKYVQNVCYAWAELHAFVCIWMLFAAHTVAFVLRLRSASGAIGATGAMVGSCRQWWAHAVILASKHTECVENMRARAELHGFDYIWAPGCTAHSCLFIGREDGAMGAMGATGAMVGSCSHTSQQAGVLCVGERNYMPQEFLCI